jgi:BolA protein
MTLASWIEQTLRTEFKPGSIAVTDDSEKHHGHSGWREGGETHFSVHIVSDAFIGKSRIERHRMVNAALAEAFNRGLHALAITAKASGE